MVACSEREIWKIDVCLLVVHGTMMRELNMRVGNVGGEVVGDDDKTRAENDLEQSSVLAIFGAWGGVRVSVVVRDDDVGCC